MSSDPFPSSSSLVRMNMRPTSTLLITFFLFLSSIPAFLTPVRATDEEDHGMRLELIHKYSQHSKEHGFHDNERPKTQLQLIKQLQHHDNIRHQMIFNKRQHQQNYHHGDQEGLDNNTSISSIRRNDMETLLTLPINSAWDYGHGVYLVRVSVGTPAQTFMLIADTASDLTWVHCRHGCGERCGTHGGRVNHKRMFLADRSSTFQTVPCSSQLCKLEFMLMFSLQICPTPLAPCRYDYRYTEESSALGFFANETVTALLTNGKPTKLNNVVIGCTESIHARRGRGSITGGDGILGLGVGMYSFTAKAAKSFGDKFSYCLVDIQSHKNVTGHITFGGKTNPSVKKKMIYTELNPGTGDDDAFYGVNVQGISIGGKMLNIPMGAWKGTRCGTILDSGTSITKLAMSAYRPVINALKAALSKFKNTSEEDELFEFCFNPAGFSEAMVPKLVFHFADGAKFEPEVSGYVIDVGPGRKCIGLQAFEYPGMNIIGNLMQQNHLWEIQLFQNKIGFAPSTCT